MTPAEIARSLTEAQRKWLPTFKEEPFGGYPIGMSKRTLEALIEAGLVEKHRPPHFGPIKWNLTPLGLKVRAALERMNDEQ